MSNTNDTTRATRRSNDIFASADHAAAGLNTGRDLAPQTTPEPAAPLTVDFNAELTQEQIHTFERHIGGNDFGIVRRSALSVLTNDSAALTECWRSEPEAFTQLVEQLVNWLPQVEALAEFLKTARTRLFQTAVAAGIVEPDDDTDDQTVDLQQVLVTDNGEDWPIPDTGRFVITMKDGYLTDFERLREPVTPETSFSVGGVDYERVRRWAAEHKPPQQLTAGRHFLCVNEAGEIHHYKNAERYALVQIDHILRLRRNLYRLQNQLMLMTGDIGADVLDQTIDAFDNDDAVFAELPAEGNDDE